MQQISTFVCTDRETTHVIYVIYVSSPSKNFFKKKKERNQTSYSAFQSPNVPILLGSHLVPFSLLLACPSARKQWFFFFSCFNINELIWIIKSLIWSFFPLSSLVDSRSFTPQLKMNFKWETFPNHLHY